MRWRSVTVLFQHERFHKHVVATTIVVLLTVVFVMVHLEKLSHEDALLKLMQPKTQKSSSLPTYGGRSFVLLPKADVKC